MVKRLLTSAIGIVIFFSVIFAHHYVLYVVGTILTLGMLFEMYRMMDADKTLSAIGYVASFIICGGFIINKPILATIISLIIFMIAIIALHGKTDSKKVLSVAFITVAISVFMSTLFLIRKYCDKFSVILPFVCAWLSDTGAYFIGSLMGKHKLCENISPKKTVEGAVAGLIFSTVGAAAYICIMVYLTFMQLPAPIHIIKFAVLGLTGGLISQIGDISASCIKRDFGKKDFGNLLPGHGGLLDRFDSVLLTIPFVFYMMVYFIL